MGLRMDREAARRLLTFAGRGCANADYNIVRVCIF